MRASGGQPRARSSQLQRVHADELAGGDEETAFGDALRSDAGEGVFQGFRLAAGEAALGEGIESLGESGGDGVDFVAGFVGEFQTEMGDAGVQPSTQMTGAVLRFGAKDGVAATHVGQQGMGAALGIAQRNHVRFTGTTAILIAGAGGEIATEDAVLRVKDGQVLVGDQFQAGRSQAMGEVQHLGGVQVVGGSDAMEAEIEVGLGGDGIGDVQAEVAGEDTEGMGAQGLKHSSGADEQGAVEAQQELKNTLFTRLQHTRGGYPDSDAAGADTLHGRLKAVEVKVIQGDAGGLQGEGGIQLRRGAHQQVEMQSSGGRGLMDLGMR